MRGSRRPTRGTGKTAVPEVQPLRLFVSGEPVEPMSRSGTAGRSQQDEVLLRVAGTARLLASAKARFAEEVAAAREAGISWRRISQATGVPFQTLYGRHGRVP